jgi:hypothetical protein
MSNLPIRKISLNGGVLYVNVVGSVNNVFVDRVISMLIEAYRVLGEIPELVELYIYEFSDVKRNVLLGEALELGISVLGDYPVSHDAWMSWPRIHIDYEKCRDLLENYFKALLYHEVVHSILHGSLISYIVNTSNVNLGAIRIDPLEVVYLASVIVKDIEVHKYLAEKGLLSILRDYYEYTKSNLREIQCDDLRGLLELAKLISPCILINCELSTRDLHNTCQEKYLKLLKTLCEVKTIQGDLNSKIQKLIEKTITIYTTP